MSQSQCSTYKSVSFLALVGSLAAAILLTSMAGLASALPAPTLFLTTGGTGDNPGSKVASPSELWRVDPATGGTTSAGNTGYAITGLAQDPTTGALYGVTNAKSPIAPLTLITIDPATGAATPIGSLGEEHKIADISFDSSGRLFGWWDEPEDNLVSIDKSNGNVTPIGNAGISTSGSGSAFDRDDNFWLLGEGEGAPADEEGTYYTVDTATGVPTERGQLSPIDENASSMSAASFDCARSTLYATVNNYGKPPANLVTVDLATGTLTNKGLVPTAADGLEWYCPLAFEFASGPIKVAAKKQSLTIPVVRGPRIKGAASVNFATAPGSAKAGKDFVAVSGTVAFANNLADGSVTVTIKGNRKAGKNVKFQLALSSPTAGGTVGAPLQFTVLAAKPKPAKVKGPKQTSAERVVFKLRSAQLPARFRCKLDKGKFKGCGKNGKKGKKYKTPALEPGKHKLVVQVVNGAGKKSKPVKKLFTVLP
jgi:Calx-beta domain